MGQDQQIMTAQTSGQSGADQPQTALHRKAQAGRVEHQTRAMSVPKALRLTLAKVADDLFDMVTAAIGVRMEQRGGDALGDLFDGPVLLMSLDGPPGRCGAAVLDPLLVGGLIQQQTTGKVMPETGDVPRPSTTTDAAICAPFLDVWILPAANGRGRSYCVCQSCPTPLKRLRHGVMILRQSAVRAGDSTDR